MGDKLILDLKSLKLLGGGKPESAQTIGVKPAALKEAMKAAISFAESKLGAKMPNLSGDSEDNSNIPNDYVMVEKPQPDLKDGPVLKSTLGIVLLFLLVKNIVNW